MLGEMTGADKVMHPQQFGTDRTHIRIQIKPTITVVIVNAGQLISVVNNLIMV